MKISILSPYDLANNYGQQLQAFALQKFLRDIGHDAFLIRYDFSKGTKRSPFAVRLLKALNPVLLCNYLKTKNQKRKLRKDAAVHPRHFEEFREKNFFFGEKTYFSFAELESNPPDADIFIVGSDQVWNFGSARPWQTRNAMRLFFLDFAESGKKRISYAASWGRRNIPQCQIKEIAPMLQKFDFVSVREKNGIALCRQCGFQKAKWVCDPTLLLDADVYRNIYRESRSRFSMPKKPYLLMYLIDTDRTKFDKRAVYNFAKDKGLVVAYVSGNSLFDSYPKIYATIPQWLCLVDNAEYVVTNSFHGCVFSILFHRKFGVIKNKRGKEGQNTRLESLFEMTNCGDRCISEKNFSVLEKEYETEKDFALKIESKKFLSDAIELCADYKKSGNVYGGGYKCIAFSSLYFRQTSSSLQGAA